MPVVINKILGKYDPAAAASLPAEPVVIEWFEAGKKILHKATASGMEVVLRLINAPRALERLDIIYVADDRLLYIEIHPCPVLVIRPRSMYEMAAVVYEIGNKHLPLFYQDEALLVPFEQPLYRLLTAAGFAPQREEHQLLHPLKTSVSPHGHTGPSLFSRIMQITGNNG